MSDIDIARRSARGSLILFGGNFLSTGITAVSSVVIARLLGPDGYGAYTLALLVPNILIAFVGLGVGVGITRFSAYHIALGEEEVARRMTRNGMVFLLIFAALLTLVSYLIAGFVSSEVLKRPELSYLGEVASLTVLSQGAVQSVTSALLGHNAMRTISFVNVLQATVKLVLSVSLVLLGLGALGALEGMVASYYLAGGTGIFALYVVVRGTGGAALGSFLSDNLRMMRYGFPHLAGGLISILSTQYVTIILADVAANAAVGNYQSAQNVLAAVYLTSSALTLTLLPAFAHLHGIKSDTALAFQYAVKYASFIVGPIVFFTIGAATPLVRFLYGASFTTTDQYLVLLGLSVAPVLLGQGILPSFFSGLGKTRLSLYFFAVGGAFQFALAPLFAFSFAWGVPGLIYSVVISNVASTMAGLYFAKKFFDATIDVRSMAAILVVLLVSSAPLLLLRLLPIGSLLLLAADILCFLGVYLTAAPVLGAVTSDDITRLSLATSGMGILSEAFERVLEYERKIIRATRAHGPKARRSDPNPERG
jgi:O-antigen/teichoic acid export membrane protein